MYVQRQTHTHSRTHTRGNILRIRLAAQQIWRRVHFMHTKKLQNRSQQETEQKLELERELEEEQEGGAAVAGAC